MLLPCETLYICISYIFNIVCALDAHIDVIHVHFRQPTCKYNANIHLTKECIHEQQAKQVFSFSSSPFFFFILSQPSYLHCTDAQYVRTLRSNTNSPINCLYLLCSMMNKKNSSVQTVDAVIARHFFTNTLFWCRLCRCCRHINIRV